MLNAKNGSDPGPGRVSQAMEDHTEAARHLVAIIRKAEAGRVTSNQLREFYRGASSMEKLEKKFCTGFFGQGATRHSTPPLNAQSCT